MGARTATGKRCRPSPLVRLSAATTDRTAAATISAALTATTAPAVITVTLDEAINGVVRPLLALLLGTWSAAVLAEVRLIVRALGALAPS